MIRRIIISIAAASSAVLLMASISPAHAQEITFQAPAALFKHRSVCKSGTPPCDNFKVVSQFQVTDDFDLDDDLSNQEVMVFFALGTTCNQMQLTPVFNSNVPAGQMVVKHSGSNVKYSFKGTVQGFDDSNMSTIPVELKLSIKINGKGKGLLKASGTGDFAAITSSPFVFALVPINEPDPGMGDNDFNCGVATAKIINQ